MARSETMKALAVAASLLLLLVQSEALNCNCSGIKDCPLAVETCKDPGEVCASAIFYGGPNPKIYRGCMKLHQCLGLNYDLTTGAWCCRNDLCN